MVLYAMIMNIPVSPQVLLALAAALFLLGCFVAAVWPNRWRLALALLLPASALTVWVVFGPELRAFVASVQQSIAAHDATPAAPPPAPR